MSRIGGRLINYYVTLGEYDFMVVAEAPDAAQIATALLTAVNGSRVTDLETTLALSLAEAKGAFAAASELARSFRPPGGSHLYGKMPDPAWEGPGILSLANQ